MEEIMKMKILLSMVLATVLVFGMVAFAELPNPGMKVVPGG
jgi:hypothetical protein